MKKIAKSPFLLTVIAVILGSTSIYANTCRECETTFWPREGENGRVCPNCLRNKNTAAVLSALGAIAQEQREAREKERAAELRQTDRVVKSRDAYNESHYSWEINCPTGAQGYSFFIEGKNGHPLWGSVESDQNCEKNQNFVPRDSKISKQWIEISEKRGDERVSSFCLPKRYKNDRINIVLKDSSGNWYGIKNLKVTYENSEGRDGFMNLVFTPISNGVKVKVFPGITEEGETLIVNANITKHPDSNKYHSVTAE